MVRKALGEDPTTTCNAKTKKGLCDEDAGANTAHIGFGRCWKHGGASIVPGTGRQLQLPTADGLKAIVERSKDDPDIFNLRREVAISRGVSEYVQNMIMQEEDVDITNGLLRTLNVFLNTTAKISKTLHEIENGRKYVVSVQEVKKVIEDMVAIISEEVEDPALQQKILDRVLKNQLGNTVIAPPESYRYADAWYESKEEGEYEDRDRGEEIVHRLNQSIKEPVDVEVPERLSLGQYKRTLKVDEIFFEDGPQGLDSQEEQP